MSICFLLQLSLIHCVLKILATTSSCINPIFYGWSNKAFRTSAFKVIEACGGPKLLHSGLARVSLLNWALTVRFTVSPVLLIIGLNMRRTVFSTVRNHQSKLTLAPYVLYFKEMLLFWEILNSLWSVLKATIQQESLTNVLHIFWQLSEYSETLNHSSKRNTSDLSLRQHKSNQASTSNILTVPTRSARKVG